MTNEMNWLVSIGLINAVLVTLLAAAACAAGRFWRQPALGHVLWVVVLLKLLTPPLVEIPVGWKLDISFADSQSPALLSGAQRFSEEPIVSEAAAHAVQAFPQVAARGQHFGEALG